MIKVDNSIECRLAENLNLEEAALMTQVRKELESLKEEGRINNIRDLSRQDVSKIKETIKGRIR